MSDSNDSEILAEEGEFEMGEDEFGMEEGE